MSYKVRKIFKNLASALKVLLSYNRVTLGFKIALFLKELVDFENLN